MNDYGGPYTFSYYNDKNTIFCHGHSIAYVRIYCGGPFFYSLLCLIYLFTPISFFSWSPFLSYIVYLICLFVNHSSSYSHFLLYIRTLIIYLLLVLSIIYSIIIHALPILPFILITYSLPPKTPEHRQTTTPTGCSLIPYHINLHHH